MTDLKYHCDNCKEPIGWVEYSWVGICIACWLLRKDRAAYDKRKKEAV